MNIAQALQLIDSIKGVGRIELWRGDECIAADDFHNGITNQGKNGILDAYFNDSGSTPNWNIGLIDAAGYTSLSPNDTPASHTGWVEWTHTSDTLRLDWAQGSASGQQVTNAVVIETTITVAGTLQGIFVTTDPAKGGTTGVFWSTALFNSPLVASAGDKLKLTFAVQL